MENKKIVWQGQPSYKARWAFLEIFGGGAEIGPYTAILPTILLFVIICLIQSINTDNYFFAFVLGIILFVILFGAEFHKSIRRKNTKYILTDEKLIIHDYWYGNKQKHEIKLSNVAQFYLVNYADNCDQIHIFINSEKTFSTRNFWSGSIRPTLALEDIANCSSVFELFEDKLEKYRKNTIDRKVKSSFENC